jgi:chemotaxis protein MotB
MEGRGLVISLKQAAYFPSGGDAVASESANSIEKIATVIRGIPNQVRLEGHTDSVPIHTDRFRSNWELSAARSIAMLELLSTKYQIPHQRFGIAGYADTVPIAPNDSEENRARNRRVDIVLLNQSVALKGKESPEPTPLAPGAHDKKPSPLEPAHKK